VKGGAGFEPEFLRDLKRDRRKYRSILSRLLRWDTLVPAFLLFLGGGLTVVTYLESGPVDGQVVPGIAHRIRELRLDSGRRFEVRYEFTFQGETRRGSSDLVRSEIPPGLAEGSEIEIVVNPWIPSINRPDFRPFKMGWFVVGIAFAVGSLAGLPFAIRSDRRKRACLRNVRRCVKTLASADPETGPRAVIEYLASVRPEEYPYDLERLREQWARTWISRLPDVWLGRLRPVWLANLDRRLRVETKGKTGSVRVDPCFGVDLPAMERYREMTDADGFLRLLDSALDYVFGGRKKVPPLEVEAPDRVTPEGVESEMLRALEDLVREGEAENPSGGATAVTVATGGFDWESVLRNERVKLPWMVALFHFWKLIRIAEGKEEPVGLAAYGPDAEAVQAWKKEGETAHLWAAALDHAGLIGPEKEETNEENLKVLGEVIQRFVEKKPAADLDGLFPPWEEALIEAGVVRGFDDAYELSAETDGKRHVLRALNAAEVLREVSGVLFTFYLRPWRWQSRDSTFRVVTREGREYRVRLLFNPDRDLRLELL